MNADTVEIVQWAAEECDRQRSGELSVAWMVKGWQFAKGWAGRPLQRKHLLALAEIVEPRHNDGSGFRQVGVRVGFNVKMPWQQVSDAIDWLLATQDTITPDEFFREYEEIHPLRDGNGRTGSIIWNWMRGTLSNPEAPPDFWADENYEAALPTLLDALEETSASPRVRDIARAVIAERRASSGGVETE